MADVLLPQFGRTCWGYSTSSFAFSSHVVDASNEGIGAVLQALDANAITHLGFRYGARTGTPPTYIIGLESPAAATGFPDGTVLGGGSPASATFTPPADTSWDGLWQWIALTNSYTPTIGQQLCPTIRYSSGTIDGSNNSSFTTHVTGADAGARFGDPYGLRNTSGTWAKQTNPMVIGVRTASTRYGNVIETLPATTNSTSTVGIRRALQFSLPSGICASFKVIGVRLTSSMTAIGKNPILGLWSASSLLQSRTLDTDIVGSATNANFSHDLYFNGPLATLTPGTTYYIGYEVADAVNGGVGMSGFTVASADDLLAHAGGTAFCHASYDGANWTTDTTTRPFAHIILSDMTGGSGGGGAATLINGGLVSR